MVPLVSLRATRTSTRLAHLPPPYPTPARPATSCRTTCRDRLRSTGPRPGLLKGRRNSRIHPREPANRCVCLTVSWPLSRIQNRERHPSARRIEVGVRGVTCQSARRGISQGAFICGRSGASPEAKPRPCLAVETTDRGPTCAGYRKRQATDAAAALAAGTCRRCVVLRNRAGVGLYSRRP